MGIWGLWALRAAVIRRIAFDDAERAGRLAQISGHHAFLKFPDLRD